MYMQCLYQFYFTQNKIISTLNQFCEPAMDTILKTLTLVYYACCIMTAAASCCLHFVLVNLVHQVRILHLGEGLLHCEGLL